MIFFKKLTFTICLKVLACAKLKKSCYCKKLCKKDTELFCSCNIHISISRLKSVKRVSLLFTSFCRIFPKITIFFGTYSPLIWKKLAQKRANSVFLFPSVEHQNTVYWDHIGRNLMVGFWRVGSFALARSQWTLSQ